MKKFGVRAKLLKQTFSPQYCQLIKESHWVSLYNSEGLIGTIQSALQQLPLQIALNLA